MKWYTQADAKWAFRISGVELFTQNLEKRHFQSTEIKQDSKEKPNQWTNQTKNTQKSTAIFPSKITCTKK